MRPKYFDVFCGIVLLLSMSDVTLAQEDNFDQSDVKYELSMDLDEAIATAQSQSTAALIAKHCFLVGYWQFRTYHAEMLPSLKLMGNLGQYNRSLVALQNSETGVINYVNNNTLENNLSLSLNQNITFTGGTISLVTGLDRLDQFAPFKKVTYNSQPLYLSISQPLNGYNYYKWERKIEPKQYELAKRNYLETMEDIAVTTVEYFFDLLAAQKTLDMAQKSHANTAQLYEIAKERFKIGTISRDEVLQLELKLLNDDLSISDCVVSEQIAMIRLRNYLGYNESVNLTLTMPSENSNIELSYHDVIEKVFANSATSLENDVNLLSSQQALAQAKSTAGFSANLSLQFGLNQVASKLPDAYRSPLDQEIVGLSLTVPILDWGLGKGRVKKAESQLEVVQSQIEQSINLIRENVALKVMQFNRQGKQCDVSRKADEVGQKRYFSIRDRFMSGTVGVTELNNAQSEMDAASLRYLQDLSDWWQYYYSIRQMTLYDYFKGEKLNADFEKLSGQKKP